MEIIEGIVEAVKVREKNTGVKIGDVWGSIWNDKMPPGIEKGVNVKAQKEINGTFTNWTAIKVIDGGASVQPPASPEPRRGISTGNGDIDRQSSIMAQSAMKAAVDIAVQNSAIGSCLITADHIKAVLDQVIMDTMGAKNEFALLLSGKKVLGNSHVADDEPPPYFPNDGEETPF